MTVDTTSVSRDARASRTDAVGRRLWRRLHRLPRMTVIFLIELYRTWISPLRLPTCRFEPTCSAYAVEALTIHGFFHGGTLAVLRLLKCGPWHKPGYDPVPEQGFRHRPPSFHDSRSEDTESDEIQSDETGTSYRIADHGVRASMEVRDS